MYTLKVVHSKAMGSHQRDSAWKDEVRIKLMEVFARDLDLLTRVQLHLDEEDREYKDGLVDPPVWRTLKIYLPSDRAFTKFANAIADKHFKQKISSSQLALIVKDAGFANKFHKSGGGVGAVGIGALTFSLDMINCLRLWWKGQLNGEQCVEQMLLYSKTMKIVSQRLKDKLKQKFFGAGFSKDKSVKNAYKFFGLKKKASRKEVMKAYERLMEQYFIDEGREDEDATVIRTNMALIGFDKGDL